MSDARVNNLINTYRIVEKFNELGVILEHLILIEKVMLLLGVTRATAKDYIETLKKGVKVGDTIYIVHYKGGFRIGNGNS